MPRPQHAAARAHGAGAFCCPECRSSVTGIDAADCEAVLAGSDDDVQIISETPPRPRPRIASVKQEPGLTADGQAGAFCRQVQSIAASVRSAHNPGAHPSPPNDHEEWGNLLVRTYRCSAAAAQPALQLVGCNASARIEYLTQMLMFLLHRARRRRRRATTTLRSERRCSPATTTSRA